MQCIAGVNSSKQFKQQMVDEFDYLVTPNVFDCAIDIIQQEEDNSNNNSNSNNGQWKVERVFGSPGYEIPEKGRLVYIVSYLSFLYLFDWIDLIWFAYGWIQLNYSWIGIEFSFSKGGR